LWLAFATMLLVSGMANTFPVFFPPLLREFGGSRGATGLTASLFWVGGAILGPVAGYVVSRGDPRWLVLAGLASAALGLAAGTIASTLAAFIAAVGIGGGIGVGLTGMTTQAALIADAYVRRRGLAIGIAFAGSMGGYALAVPAQWGVDRFGWRGAFWVYVVAIVGLMPWAWWTLPRRIGTRAPASGRPAHPPERSIGEIVGSAPFWALLAMFSTPPLFGYLATTQHALYFTVRGFSPAQASLLLGIGGARATTGRALAGWIADHLGGPAAGYLSFACSLAGMACLLAMELRPGVVFAYGYVLLLFLPLGSRATIVSVLLGRIAPPAQYGVIFGLLGIGNSLGAALGPTLSGWIYDLTRSYLVIYVCATAVALVGLSGLVVFCATTGGVRRVRG
jgi:predicted MFS family arabinose efflux permease